MSSPGDPIARSGRVANVPSSSIRTGLKSPIARAYPNRSPASALQPGPTLSWVRNRLRVLDSPLAVLNSHVTAPASVLLDTSSRGAPIARSARPSVQRSLNVSTQTPAARANPNRSPRSALSAMPGEFWVNNWLPTPDSPPVEPRSTVTAPASATADTSSPGAPTARSTKPSPLKSPAASACPNRSPASELPRTSGLFWVSNWLPIACSLPAVPYSTVTAPARTSPTSPGTPTARSVNPSPLKSPVASAAPNWSSDSALLPTPNLSWCRYWLPYPGTPWGLP